jgi:hypothetical protein
VALERPLEFYLQGTAGFSFPGFSRAINQIWSRSDSPSKRL